MTHPQGPLFSVLLRVSGQEAHLGSAVRSVWAQTSDDVEIVVIDDGAPDTVREEIDRLARQSRTTMRIVQTAATGRSRAWNVGAEAARGRLLAFLDPDDEFHPDRLDVFRRAQSICNGFTWGFSGVEAIDARSRPIAVDAIRDAALRSTMYASTVPVDAIRNLPQTFTPVSCGNLVVDARLFRELGGFRDYTAFYAWDLSLRLYRAGDPVTIERPLYRHRIRNGGEPGRDDLSRQPSLIDAEYAAVVEDYRQAVLRDGFSDNSFASPALRQAPSLDAETRAAIAATLWGLNQLRRAPLLYTAARRTARSLRRVRSRFQ